MDHAAESVIRGELGSEEQLLWCGRPAQGLCLRPSDASLIPFSLFWGSQGAARLEQAGVNSEGPLRPRGSLTSYL